MAVKSNVSKLFTAGKRAARMRRLYHCDLKYLARRQRLDQRCEQPGGLLGRQDIFRVELDDLGLVRVGLPHVLAGSLSLLKNLSGLRIGLPMKIATDGF